MAYQRAFDRAYTGEVWSASLLLNGGYSSDDGFKYFRDWLISCGAEIYLNAIEDPDSLASPEVQEDVYVDENGFSSAQYEDFGSVAWLTYEEVTGREFEEPSIVNNKPEIDWSYQDFEDIAWLQNRLPKLWSLFGDKMIELKNQDAIKPTKLDRLNVENAW